jgi:hypothetical protein
MLKGNYLAAIKVTCYIAGILRSEVPVGSIMSGEYLFKENKTVFVYIKVSQIHI